MSKSAFLVKRGNSYSIRLAVPRPLWARLGRQQVWAALGTSDLAEAKRRRGVVDAALRYEFKRALQGGEPSIREAIDRALGRRMMPGQPGWLIEATRQQRAAALDAGEDPRYSAPGEIPGPLVGGMDALVERYIEDGGNPAVIPTAWGVFDGTAGVLLSEAIQRHLKDLTESKRTQAWQNDVKRELEAFATWLGHDVGVSELTRQHAAQYASEKVGPRSCSPVRRINRLGILRGFGKWMDVHGLRTGNPFEHVVNTVKEPKRADAAKRKRAYTPAEAFQVISGLKARLPSGDPLLAVVAICAYSGARLEEICDLRVTEVAADRFVVARGKNDASARTVPLHPCIAPMVNRLREQAADEYLIPGLTRGGTDKKRSHALSTRYRRWLDRLGDYKTVDGHSWRRAFETRAENAGIARSTQLSLTGRSRMSLGLGLGLYSAGPDWDRLVDAMSKITYNPEVDALVRSL